MPSGQRWRRRLWVVLAAAIPFGTAGIATFAVIGWYAARRGRVLTGLAAFGYLCVLWIWLVLLDADEPHGVTGAIGVLAWVFGWLGGTAHAAVLASTSAADGKPG